MTQTKKIELPQVQSATYYKAYKTLNEILERRGYRTESLPESRQNDILYGMALMIEAASTPVYCSQCGGEFPRLRDRGYSHCTDHEREEVSHV